MQTKKLKIVQILAIIFLFIGSIGWFVPFFGRPFRSWIELPNTEPKGIALDSKGNIYCGSKGYGRIQKYYPNGRFMRGFDVEGGFWRGSDFGFRINEKEQLCITVSGMSKDYKGSIHRLRIYDQQGKLVHTERDESNNTNYWHDMNNYTADSVGNGYTFKGFLFPRVIKQTPAGDRSIIISTPIWLWFFQAPFPAFAFFFVSIFVIVYLSDDAALLEATVKYFSDSAKRRKFVVSALVILLFIFALTFLIFVGFKTYPAIIIFGLISFGIMFALVGLVSLVYALKRTWYYRKHYPEFSGKCTTCSIRERLEFSKAIREATANDPLLCKMEAKVGKFVKLCFVVWFIIFIIATITIIRIGPILK